MQNALLSGFSGTAWPLGAEVPRKSALSGQGDRRSWSPKELHKYPKESKASKSIQNVPPGDLRHSSGPWALPGQSATQFLQGP